MSRVFTKDRIQQGDITAIDEIEMQAQSQLHGRVSDLHLFVCGEGLILRGHAHTYYAKQIAQHAVMKATHLPIVRNEIEVC